MSYLKPGTRCVLVGGCPENIGLIVEVLEHIGLYPPCADAYKISTVSGRLFPQFWNENGLLITGFADECFTDRHKLCPLVDPKEESESRETDVEIGRASCRERV